MSAFNQNVVNRAKYTLRELFPLDKKHIDDAVFKERSIKKIGTVLKNSANNASNSKEVISLQDAEKAILHMSEKTFHDFKPQMRNALRNVLRDFY